MPDADNLHIRFSVTLVILMRLFMTVRNLSIRSGVWAVCGISIKKFQSTVYTNSYIVIYKVVDGYIKIDALDPISQFFNRFLRRIWKICIIHQYISTYAYF